MIDENIKKLKWKRIVWYVIGILVLFKIVSEVYMSGFFHPKEFRLNGIKLSAPKNTYLTMVDIGNDNVFNLFSPLTLNFTSEGHIKNRGFAWIQFRNPHNNNEFIFKSITAVRKKLSYFHELVFIMKESESLIISPIIKKYDNCNELYLINDKEEKSGVVIQEVLLFNYKKNILFTIMTDIKTDLNISIREVCNN